MCGCVCICLSLYVSWHCLLSFSHPSTSGKMKNNFPRGHWVWPQLFQLLNHQHGGKFTVYLHFKCANVHECWNSCHYMQCISRTTFSQSPQRDKALWWAFLWLMVAKSWVCGGRICTSLAIACSHASHTQPILALVITNHSDILPTDRRNGHTHTQTHTHVSLRDNHATIELNSLSWQAFTWLLLILIHVFIYIIRWNLFSVACGTHQSSMLAGRHSLSVFYATVHDLCALLTFQNWQVAAVSCRQADLWRRGSHLLPFVLEILVWTYNGFHLS